MLVGVLRKMQNRTWKSTGFVAPIVVVQNFPSRFASTAG